MAKENGWSKANTHISGRVLVGLEDREMEQSAETVLYELNMGRKVDGLSARRALGKSEHDAKPGDVWILDPKEQGLYLLAPGVNWYDRAWTVISWTALSDWGRRRVAEAVRGAA